MRTRISTRGRIVLPAKLRRQDGIEPGQKFEIERLDRGEYRIVRREPAQPTGLIDLLLSCPEKDFFVPIPSDFAG